MKTVLSFTLVIVLCLTFCGCAPEQTNQFDLDSAMENNLFVNGSFEQGSDPWTSMTTKPWGKPFTAVSDVAHSGNNSSLLEHKVVSQTGKGFICGVMQEITPEKFPQKIGGHYYVKRWKRGAEKQYLQFVVMAFKPGNMFTHYQNYQIRYVLTNIDKPPFMLNNAKYIFINSEEPKEYQWVHFERDVAKDFQEQWGTIPEDFEKVRVLYEVRTDGQIDSPCSAHVHFDDLYALPAEE